MMDDFHFTPEKNLAEIDIPFFEDSRADVAPYYRSQATIASAQSQVLTELAKLGGGSIQFVPGHFGDRPRRYGYLVHYWYGGVSGVIRVAGLPIRVQPASKKKIEQVRVQALLVVRDWLKASVTQIVFNPGSNPLIQHLLVDGRRTVADFITETGRLPAITAGDEQDIIDGEIVEGTDE